MTDLTTFHTLCTILQQIRETRGSNTKISICATYLMSLKHDEDLYLAARYISEGAFDNISEKRASVGSRTTGLAAADFCEIDYDLVFKPCRTATGSGSETIEKLMDSTPAARKKRKPVNRTLKDVEGIFEQLYSVSGRAKKQEILQNSWQTMTPVEIKYFIRMLGQGSLRIGFETRSLLSAIARAFKVDTESVRYAHMITGSAGRTAVLARSNRLDEAKFKLFHPLTFMLASPVESQSLDNLEEYICEEKFDGMRCQLHADQESVKLYSRDLNDITHTFPDLIEFFSTKKLPPLVLDGEICVFIDETIMPFQMLQKRMGVKKPGKKILSKYPVLFIAYDLLFVDGLPIFDNNLLDRRKQLLYLSKQYNFPVASQFEVENYSDLDQKFEEALAHGNEGLILKKKESVYEYGQRKKSWLKLKKPGGSFDTVIMYAHAGSGKRGGTYSDFTLGISVKDDERYEEEFVPIGKAYGGYTNEELNVLNKKIKELTAERYGPTLGLLPGLIVEIEFDTIQINKRTKAGYTLRLPRFKAIRWDLGPDSVDTLKDVEAAYLEILETKREKQDINPSFIIH